MGVNFIVTPIPQVMLSHIYLRKDTVYVPTVVQTEAGFYMDIDPVRVAIVSDSKGMQDAILEALSKGTPRVIPTPNRGTFPKPILLNYTKVKSWSAFEKDAFVWTICEKAGSYQIIPSRRRVDRGWEDDPEQVESFPQGTPPDLVAQRMICLVRIALGGGVENRK